MSARSLLVVLLVPFALAAGSARAAYSGGNGSIVFIDDTGAIAVYAPGTGVVSKLLAADSKDPRSAPTWAPDGRSIAFVQRGPDANESTAGVRIRFAGGGTISDVGIWGYVSLPAPSWSPDSSSLLDAGQTTNSDATGYSKIAWEGSVVSPTLSPDGAHVVYASYQYHAIEIADADGSNARAIAPWLASECQSGQRYAADEPAFSWSPDGTRVAYCDRYDLIVANADGSGSTTLVHQIANGRPSWSPDGTQIVVPTEQVGHPVNALEIVNADGTGGHDVLDSHGNEVVGTDPDWGRTPPSPPDTTSPRPVSPPTVVGTPSYGKILVGKPGSWSGDPVRMYTYEWQRCTSSGDNCVDVQTSAGGQSSYEPLAPEIGHRLRLVVTATTAGGQARQSVTTEIVGGHAPGSASSTPTPQSPSPTTPTPVTVKPALTIRTAHASWAKSTVRIRLTACGGQGPVTAYATDWNVVHGRAQAKHHHTWRVAGTTSCVTSVHAWKAVRRPDHRVALRVRDAAGKWSRTVRMTLR